ncbi:hypothetical protein [Fodinibius saliphilus]|uniref:hypothetical protein n=1 Tax=Fodinibius saliphilus TaxID=1920650 RepID=UPI00148629A5|nr:hypothetical protein [Fodinibius saliphilus]
METLELHQMEQIEGGRDVNLEVCQSQDLWAHAVRVIPGVGSFCLGVAIGNYFY